MRRRESAHRRPGPATAISFLASDGRGGVDGRRHLPGRMWGQGRTLSMATNDTEGGRLHVACSAELGKTEKERR
jgi:hypothetical protein